jgi:hypothetical protein
MKVEIRISFDNMVVMKGGEDEKLLKLKETYAWAQNFAFLSHHDKGTLYFSLLWHDIFGHINYDSICLLKKMVYLVCLPFQGICNIVKLVPW